MILHSTMIAARATAMSLAFVLFCSTASAFVTSPQPNSCRTTTSLPMASIMESPSTASSFQNDDDNNNLESIFLGTTFQLEEKEDHTNCVTELWLLEDHTVQVGQSDGPLTSSVHGSWSYEPHLYPAEYAFAMKLHRTFNTGYKGTDMGEFSFTVSRTFVGRLMEIGSVLGVEGNIYHNEEDDSDSPMGNVGFFSMIDTTPSDEDDEEDGGDGFSKNPFTMRTSASF